MKKILFFTCEPGGAEILIPVIQAISKDRNFEVTVLSYGLAIDRFQKKGIPFEKIELICKDDFSILERYTPDVIITSATSLPYKDMSEKYLWDNAKQKNIRTIAFLDQWQNYAIRFSGASENEKLKYQPDLINCINSIGRKDMLEQGFENKNLVELGHPYLTTLRDIEIDRDMVLLKLGILNPNKPIIIFVSEAIEENYGHDRGYTQYETIEYFLSRDFVQEKQVIVKLHPKDDLEKFKKYTNVVWVQNELTSLEVINIADFVVGMTSIMLIEAFILNKKTLSLQLNASDDPLLLSRYDFIKKIVDSNHQIQESDFKHNGIFHYEFDYSKFMEIL